MFFHLLQVPALGHIPQIFQVMASQNNAIPKSALQVIHVLSDNEVCLKIQLHDAIYLNDSFVFMLDDCEFQRNER